MWSSFVNHSATPSAFATPVRSTPRPAITSTPQILERWNWTPAKTVKIDTELEAARQAESERRQSSIKQILDSGISPLFAPSVTTTFNMDPLAYQINLLSTPKPQQTPSSTPTRHMTAIELRQVEVKKRTAEELRERDRVREETERYLAQKRKERELSGLDYAKGMDERGEMTPAQKDEASWRIEAMLEELDVERKGTYKNAMSGGSPKELLVKNDGGEITREKAQCLRDGEWLNDEVINVFLRLLYERSLRCPELPKCYFFNTFFYAKLRNPKTGYTFKDVSRWTKRANIDIFALDKVIIPVHLGIHWCCACINFRTKQTEYYDSLGGDNQQLHADLLQYIQDEWKDKKPGQPPYDVSDWTSITPSDIPHQHNGCDCGVFSCMYADFLSISPEAKLLFKQKDMKQIRKWMLLSCLDAKVE